MIAILGGLGAALAWATATLCSSRSTRMIGATPVLGWVMVVGLVLIAPVLAAGPRPGHVDAATAGWLVVAGAGNAGGLLLVYRGLRVGKVGIVAPIVSTEGAIAAVIAMLAGEETSAAIVMTLAVIAVGIALAAKPPSADEPLRDGSGHAPVAAVYAVAAAFVFGLSLFATGRVSDRLPLAWIVLPARVAGVVAVALPLALAGRLRMTRAAAPFVLAGGVCEVLGVASFTLGARDDIAVAAVLASQFAAVAALAAFLLFGERLGRVQVVGAVVIVSGVAVLSALQA